MWHDGEIDMEELEARLYSQVYHPNGEEIPTFKPNAVQENLSANPHKRYFGVNGMHQSPYGSQTIHRVYQRHSDDNRAYFPADENVDSQPALHYRDSANFYDQIGLFRYPAINNIVVLPQPPTQIPTQHQSAERAILQERRKKNKISRKERKRRAKEKRRVEKIKKVFKKHSLSSKPVNLENKNDANGSSTPLLKDEIICLSESGSSDCEIEEPHVPSIVVSSDEEVDIEGLHHEDATVEIKNETVTKISEDIIPEQFKSKTAQAISGNNDVQLQNVQLGADDDDVVFVEPCQNEILTICDESQSVTDINSSATSNLTENNAPTTINDAVLSKVPRELVDTPESTNDFLENSFNSLQNSTDVSNNDSTQKLSVDDFESDSNFSVSDFDAPSRSAIFTEQEFDVPPKEAFSELNLDSFTNYIASKASTSIPSILTPPKRSAGDTQKNSKSKDAALRNSSDSSSESDYEDKAQLIKSSRSKRKINVDNESTSSEDDDCVADCSSVKSKTLLPNLSPITSDEETNRKVNKKSNKRKKQKKGGERVRSSGEKRKCVQNVEAVAEMKRAKQNDGSADSNKPKRNDRRETEKFFSSSDSEIEVVRIDGRSPCASVTNFDLELLNVGSSSTPIKKLGEGSTTKPKRFSDYWTEDMRKFYCESWGHEDFSVEEEQKAMSDDPVMWKIINNDEIHFRLLPRGPRCFRCREFGHRSNNCKKKIGPPKCILCGASGHVDARCPNKMCTSCGRKSQYSTTYCSRCANSRHVVCKICRMHGHTSSYCTDLWRRYYLTTTDGPLKQPSDSNLKLSKDRWCSGCATRGHFEFNCNYYNRTHPPADPLIRSYEDVYERRGPREQNISLQSRGEGRYYAPPNQVSPWIFGCEPNVYDQRMAENFIPGSNPNFYQQFPVFQSMPNIFSLQPNLSNIFYPNPELMATNRSMQDIHAPNTSRAESCIPSLMAKIIPKPNEGEFGAPSAENKKRDFLKLKNANPQQLTSRDGLDFFKKLGTDLDVKIKIIKRKKKKKHSYWCLLEGAPELVSSAKESIKKHFSIELEAKPITFVEMSNSKDFSMQMLQESMSKLENLDTDWPTVAFNLHEKIKEVEKKLVTLKDNADQSNNTKDLKNTLKSRYIALNTILLGKLDFARGLKHMKILKQAVSKGVLVKVTEEKLKQSYNYVFRNHNRFNLNYGSAIVNLSRHEDVKEDIKQLFQSGSSICRDNNMSKNLIRLKYSYRSVVSCKYSQRYVARFRKLYSKIKKGSEK